MIRGTNNGTSQRLWSLFIALLFLTSTVFAQSTAEQQSQPASPPTATQSAEPQSAPQSAPAEKKPDAGAPKQDENSVTIERKISKDEARALLNSVDEILQFVSKDTGLPIKHKVKRKLATRDEVVRYLQDRMKEDKDTERLERASTTLKKFGLLPRDFNLRPYLVELLKEQVAGFYDTRTKTVYLLDWVEPEAQQPVLAHELTHALQDQNFGMEKWAEVAKNSKDDTESAVLDEARSARQAVIEGQAMVVLIDYTLTPLKKSVATAPELVDAMKAGMTGDATSPIFTRSPLFLRESLVFPYTWGLDFVRGVLKARGVEGAFAGILKEPPADTRQVMEPATYLASEQWKQMPIPDIKPLIGSDAEVFDTGGIGEFDVYVMLKQWIGSDATKLSKQWRGGYYVTTQNKSKSAPVSLLFKSKWASPEDAEAFGKYYIKGLEKRYQKVELVESALPRTWMTEEGPVEVEVRGDTLIVTEGFEREKAKELRGK